MFRAKTVMVIGAGASVEVGLPMGPELLRSIVQLTDIKFNFNRQSFGDHLIIEALRIHLNEGASVVKLNAHIKAGWRLAKSATQAMSIDNVIDALENSEVELIGKLGIVRAIWRAEAASLFFRVPEGVNEGLNLSKFNDNWYGSLTKLLTENVKLSEIEGIFDNFQIINFNYDRCLEHYLPFSLAGYYGVELAWIRELMQRLVVHRPYGVAGKLPWQVGVGPSADFGGGSAQCLSDVAQQVRTFTERVEEGEQLAAMKASIANADRVIFLGFAFHRQNVELLATKMQDHAEILATCFRISESDKSVIEEELEKAFQHEFSLDDKRITLTNATCAQLFQEYWRTMTAVRGEHEPYANSMQNIRSFQMPVFGQIFGKRR
ncbi:hypothetical protein [Sphingomonas ursincola]|uniref:SIR2-like domain-containing protein n=1 Tax=Sphingomonas ursincola TaxID=56361 RepID=A0A7V8RDX6_9SPHN|nr:hypothetical protein [Sphingomonas ursincola]MBA1374643.1 hypothetical protein [Sphingomonas ursincola]